MRPGSLSIALSLLLSVAGCGASKDKAAIYDGEVNCVEDADCGAGVCSDGVCVTKSSSLKYVLVEVSPPAGTGEYGQLRFLHPWLLDGSGSLNLELEVAAELTVGVSPPSDQCPTQNLDDSGFMPISVEVLRDSGINGILAENRIGQPKIELDGTPSNQVGLTIAPGPADVYIVPKDEQANSSNSGGLCDVAPALALSQTIFPGRVSLKQRLPPAEHLNVDVVVPDDLEGWTIDMVEPLRGRRISSQSVLGTPKTGADGLLHHGVRLAYHTVTGPDSERLKGAELLRLRPPATLRAPTYYVAWSATSLFDTDSITVSQLPSIPPIVTINGTVESATDGLPLRADVVAMLEPSDPAVKGALVKFEAVTSSDDKGQFTFELVSGNYKVLAIPYATGPHATLSTSWSVATSPPLQSGRLLRVGRRSSLTGVLFGDPRDEPLAGAAITARPSNLSKAETFLGELLGNGDVTGVRSQTVLADEQGAFEIPLDPGRYDIAVRPPEGMGYPWSVRPNVVLDAEETKPLSIQILLPNAFTGTVTVPGQSAESSRQALPDTLLRFYAVFDEGGQLADGTTPLVSGVEIGHARTDASGAFRILLPERLD